MTSQTWQQVQTAKQKHTQTLAPHRKKFYAEMLKFYSIWIKNVLLFNPKYAAVYSLNHWPGPAWLPGPSASMAVRSQVAPSPACSSRPVPGPPRKAQPLPPSWLHCITAHIRLDCSSCLCGSCEISYQLYTLSENLTAKTTRPLSLQKCNKRSMDFDTLLRFGDVIVCHKRSSYCASLVQTGSSYFRSLLTESLMPAM